MRTMTYTESRARYAEHWMRSSTTAKPSSSPAPVTNP